MMLGALVDLGVPVDTLRRGLATLPVRGYALTARRWDFEVFCREVLRVKFPGGACCAKPTKVGWWRPVQASVGTISWPGRWRKAGLAWKTWP